MTSDNASTLLNRLLSWLLKLIDADEQPFVVQKLCSTLVTFFFRRGESWENCIRHLICCFAENEIVPQQDLPNHPPTHRLVDILLPEQTRCVVWFATALVEEVSKTNASGLKTSGYYEKVNSNTPDMLYVFDKATKPSRVSTSITEEAIKCFQSWVMFAQRVWSEDSQEQTQLKTITPHIIDLLDEDKIFDVAAFCLIDIMENFPAFLTIDGLGRLAGKISSESADKTLQQFKDGGFNTDAETFGHLILVYADMTVQDLAKAAGDPFQQKILTHCMSLLGCGGFAGVDEQISTPALEFWQTYVEFLTDLLFDTDDKTQPWIEEAKRRIFEVIETCWRKIQIPLPNVAAGWDSNDRSYFNAFRSDVQDLLQSSYTLLGLTEFETMARLSLQSVAAQSWIEVEASLFCLNSLADAVSEEATADRCLEEIFGLSLFASMSASNTVLPAKTQQTVINLIASYISFFQRHHDYLPSMLTFLFNCLERPMLAITAAKAIFVACSSCRKILYPHIDGFLQQYYILAGSTSIDLEVQEKVVGAVTAIVQALPTVEHQLPPLDRLLDLVDRDVTASEASMSLKDERTAQMKALSALSCLASMGKALQTPSDESIDLDAEGNRESGFWASGPGSVFQARVIRILAKLTSSFRSDREITEATCAVLRSGFKETSDGPFVLPYHVTTHLLSASPPSAGVGGLDHILDTATLMFNTRTDTNRSSLLSAASDCLRYIGRGLAELEGKESGELRW